MASLVGRLRPGKAMLALQRSATPLAAAHSPLPVCSQSPQWRAANLNACGSSGLLSRLCHHLGRDQEEQEIYRGILSTQIKLVKTFSLCTSVVGLACQPVLYTLSSAGNMAVVVASGAFLSFFTFATPLLIHSFSKKYVTKLYYNQVEDKYTAYVYNIFVRPKKIEFKVSDVKVPDIPGMFTTFKAKDVPLFVEGSLFQDRSHYGKIMGYDKPLDLMWDQELNMTKSQADAVRRSQQKSRS